MTRVASITAGTPVQETVGYVNMDPLIRTEDALKCAYTVHMVPGHNHLNQQIVTLETFYKPLQFV